MKFFLLSVIVILSSLHLVRADPYVGYVYPSGIQAGTTNRIVIGGQRLWSLNRGWISGEGVTVIDVSHVPVFPVPNGKGQRQWLEKWVYAIQQGRRAMPSLAKIPDEELVGWTRCSWWETMDELGDLELSMIAHNLFTPRNALQMSPSLAESAILTVVAEPGARPGVRRLILFDNRGASAPRPFLVSDERRVTEPLYSPPPRKGKSAPVAPPRVFSLPIIAEGQILPGETDAFLLSLNAGDRLSCQVTARELMPYLGDAVPGFFNPVLSLKDADGRELAFADDYSYLPDPVLACTVKNTGTYRLEIRDNLFRGRADFVYSIRCVTGETRLPPVSERAFSVDEPIVSLNDDVGRQHGVLSKPGDVAEFDFDVAVPGKWTFDMMARREGSPVDGVLRLYGPLTGWFEKTGPLLSTWDDVTNETYVGHIPQAECDPIGCWTFAEPGRYRVSVEDRNGHGGPDHTFSLKIAPAEPCFEVYANKSAFVVLPDKGKRLSFKVRVVRHNGFAGAVVLDGGDLLSLIPTVVPATNDEIAVVAEVLTRDWSGVRELSLSARAEVSPGHVVTVPLVPTDEMEQAFAYTHLLPASCFRLYNPPKDTRRAIPPEWLEMPRDRLLPKRVVLRNPLDRNECMVIEPPKDADEGLLLARLATSAVRVRQKVGRAYAYETDDPSAAPLAVLAGVQRFVDRNLAYVNGSRESVRVFSRATRLKPDNDILIFMPQTNGTAFAGSTGTLLRRLRDGGWSYDFVTDATLASAPLGRYKVVIVPCELSSVSQETMTRLKSGVKDRTIVLIVNPTNGKDVRRRLSKQCRRDVFPADLRFARFGLEWGEGWYFVYNPTSRQIEGTCRFGIRGRARSAFVMSVKTGSVTPLDPIDNENEKRFALALGAGEAAWVYVSVRER